MKASELRILNLLHFPFTAENVEVVGINAKEKNGKIENTISVSTLDNIYCEKIEVFNPIPLTEGWLIRLGFEKINSTWFKLGNFRINISYDVEWSHNWMGVRLNHVHQLQNLYFALTNTELT